MNKETFVWILQCALLNFDGVTKQELINKYGTEPQEVDIGIKLCEYLKPKKIDTRKELIQ